MYKKGGQDHKINPIYLPLKTHDYEQDMENNWLLQIEKVHNGFPLCTYG